MTKLEHNIKEIMKELSTPINKSDFLARCALDKIQVRSSLYNEQLDKYLDFLDINESNSRDLTRMTMTLTALSSLVSKSYEGLIKMISQCEKNIFQNKD